MIIFKLAGLQASLQLVLHPSWGSRARRVLCGQRARVKVLWLLPAHLHQDLLGLQPARVHQHVVQGGAWGNHHLPLPPLRPLYYRRHEARGASHQAFPRVFSTWSCSRTSVRFVYRQREVDLGRHLALYQTAHHCQAQCERSPDKVCKDAQYRRSKVFLCQAWQMRWRFFELMTRRIHIRRKKPFYSSWCVTLWFKFQLRGS